MKLSPLIIAQQNFFSTATSVSEKLQQSFFNAAAPFVLRKSSNAAASQSDLEAFFIKSSRPFFSDPYTSRTRISYFKPILRLQVHVELHLGLLLEFTPGLNLYFFGLNLYFMVSSLHLSWLYNQPGPPRIHL